MKYAIFDLETTIPSKERNQQNIIEIGAVKFDDNFDVLDSYKMYINPKVYVDKTTRKFIGANNINFLLAPTFDRVFHDFSKWFDDCQYIFSWGNDDKVLLERQCVDYNIDLQWTSKYRNLQPNISNILFERDHASLKKSVDKLNIVEVGRLHDALNDSIATFKVLKEVKDKVDIKNISMTNRSYRDEKKGFHYCADCGGIMYPKTYKKKSSICTCCRKERQRKRGYKIDVSENNRRQQKK